MSAAAKPRSPLTSREIEWVRAPRQGRSQEKLDRILDAAERLISEKGFEKTSVAQIMRRAKCSVGLFYSRFRNKDELLRFLFERFLGEVAATARANLNPERWGDLEPREALRILIEGTVRLYRERHGMIVAFHQAVLRDPTLAARTLEVVAEIWQLVDLPAAEEYKAASHANPTAALQFGLGIVLAALNERARWTQAFGMELVPDALMTEQLTLLLERYLIGPA